MNAAVVLIIVTPTPIAQTLLEVIDVCAMVAIREMGERVKVKCRIKISSDIIKVLVMLQNFLVKNL